MALHAARRKYDALHKDAPYHDGMFTAWAKERSDAYPFHYLDGVEIWVSRDDLTPDDDFLGDGSGSPVDHEDADPAD
jgi:hypothetical protein